MSGTTSIENKPVSQSYGITPNEIYKEQYAIFEA
ncbi:hypothetical protein ABIF38_008787 [Bradyrhizobium japonicum]|nr:hypothetical protein [Bradyrhizobium elkanii]MCS3452310.1 hypothetical protein [Bradyrhizobium elkanii]MCS3565587.1 hypothetical protein [Bradyrhizobium elkanii]MCS3573022.1 hypothetical protein [Bradyrhizobium elkanii]MCS3594285.1 hypothetical protein [Bradyrhizobium elkanii]